MSCKVFMIGSKMGRMSSKMTRFFCKIARITSFNSIKLFRVPSR